jgi:hypothetical protein
MSVPTYRTCRRLAARLNDALVAALRAQDCGEREFPHVRLTNGTVEDTIKALRRAARKGVR